MLTLTTLIEIFLFILYRNVQKVKGGSRKALANRHFDSLFLGWPQFDVVLSVTKNCVFVILHISGHCFIWAYLIIGFIFTPPSLSKLTIYWLKSMLCVHQRWKNSVALIPNHLSYHFYPKKIHPHNIKKKYLIEMTNESAYRKWNDIELSFELFSPCRNLESIFWNFCELKCSKFFGHILGE